jgi:hypothetical protein
MNTILELKKPFLFVGKSGTAKTVIVQKYVADIDPVLGGVVYVHTV